MCSPDRRFNSRAARSAIFLTTSLLAISYISAPVYADKRVPAPIVYAGQASVGLSPERQTDVSQPAPILSRAERPASERIAVRAVAPSATKRRVEFRYPDQPDTFYGANGVRSEPDAAPLSFSSSKSAISQADAEKYSVGSFPNVVSAAKVSLDPSITSGGFDARAAANRVTEQRLKPKFVSAAGLVDFSSAPLQSEPLPVVQKVVSQKQAPVSVSGAVFEPVIGAIYDKTGIASVFHRALNGQPTSNGEILDTSTMIAAHPSLPLPSLVQIINLDNNREVVVRVNDRGPFDGKGLIEVSERAANVLGFDPVGTANVRVRYLGPAPHIPRQTSAAPVRDVAPVISMVTLPKTKGVDPLFAQLGTPMGAGSTGSVTATPITGHAQFLVQLASFTDISNAEKLYSSFEGRIGNLGIVPAQVGGVDYFRVVAGPLTNRQAAESLRDQLANQGIGRGLIIEAS